MGEEGSLLCLLISNVAEAKLGGWAALLFCGDAFFSPFGAREAGGVGGASFLPYCEGEQGWLLLVVRPRSPHLWEVAREGLDSWACLWDP